MTPPGLRLTVPANRFLIDIHTALDGTVTLNIVKSNPLRIVDTVTLRGEQLNSLHRIICNAWESA